MRTFAQYFIERRLGDPNHVLSESTTGDEVSWSKADLSKLMREKILGDFAERFPDVQHEDMEEAFRKAIKKIAKEKISSKKTAERMFEKAMEEELSQIGGKKRNIRKNLSCIKHIKVSADSSISSAIKRAERILTTKEKKVLEMCSRGKSVRSIASELGISHPTAWRVLNSAIDKIRMSHGIRPRHKDIRKRNSGTK